MADEKNAPEDDKSINELLKEYAEDVKDKDLDDFLKDSEDDDAFEADDPEATEEEADEVLAAAGEPKKSSGLLTMMFIVVAFGAAGAGAYMYLNKDEGMTSIMGGFSSGSQDDGGPMVIDLTAPQPTDPMVSDAQPDMPDMPGDSGNGLDSLTLSMPDAPEQPLPIVNEDGSVSEVADNTAPVPDNSAPDVVMTTESTNVAPVQDGDASQAVNAWMAGMDDMTMPGSDALPDTPLPEKQVEEVKAKAPKTVAATPKEPVKVNPAAETKKVVAAAPTPKKTTSTSSSADGALPPPYVAIQARKRGEVAPSSPAPSNDNVKHSASGTGRDVEGNTNKNLADVTKATGNTADMIAKGGGIVELGTTVVQPAVPAPVGMMPKAAATPPLRTVPLAIEGGRSLPPGSSSAYAQIPATNQGTKPVAPVASEPEVPAVPVEPVRTVVPSAPAQAPVMSDDGMDARAILSQATAAEKAGRSGDALELYQKALEVDAVYGGGTSIDRGMVYDRIGAIRAGN